MLLRQCVDTVTEGMYTAMPRGVDEADRTSRGRGGLQHAHGRGDAHATGHKHERTIAIVDGRVQREIPAGRLDVQNGANPRLPVQPIGNQPAMLPLDADAVQRPARSVGQRVVPAHFLAAHVQEEREVLARDEVQQRQAVHRLQVERGDEVALGLAAGDAEFARAAPAARARRVRGIHLLLGGDQNAGQRLVCLAPGGDDLVGRGFAQHFADRAQQTVADDRVVLGQHAECGVFVDDARQSSASSSRRSMWDPKASTAPASARAWVPLAWCASLKKAFTCG